MCVVIVTASAGRVGIVRSIEVYRHSRRAYLMRRDVGKESCIATTCLDDRSRSVEGEQIKHCHESWREISTFVEWARSQLCDGGLRDGASAGRVVHLALFERSWEVVWDHEGSVEVDHVLTCLYRAVLQDAKRWKVIVDSGFGRVPVEWVALVCVGTEVSKTKMFVQRMRALEYSLCSFWATYRRTWRETMNEERVWSVRSVVLRRCGQSKTFSVV